MRHRAPHQREQRGSLKIDKGGILLIRRADRHCKHAKIHFGREDVMAQSVTVCPRRRTLVPLLATICRAILVNKVSINAVHIILANDVPNIPQTNIGSRVHA